MGRSGGRGPPLTWFLLRLWERSVALAAANRERKVPPAACTSRLACDSLGGPIRGKWEACDGLVGRFAHAAKGRPCNGPRPVLQPFVAEACRRHPTNAVFPDASGEEPFAGLVRARVDLARKSDPGPTHEGAAKWAREGRAATAPVSRQTTKVIVAMEDCVPRTEVGFLVAACRNFDSPRRRNA